MTVGISKVRISAHFVAETVVRIGPLETGFHETDRLGKALLGLPKTGDVGMGRDTPARDSEINRWRHFPLSPSGSARGSGRERAFTATGRTPFRTRAIAARSRISRRSPGSADIAVSEPAGTMARISGSAGVEPRDQLSIGQADRETGRTERV